MSEYIDAVLDGVEEGLNIFNKINRLSKKYERIIQKSVIASNKHIKGDDNIPGDSKNLDQTPNIPPSNVVDLELDSTGKYIVKPKVLKEK